MVCRPDFQLYDGSRYPVTNLLHFTVEPTQVSEIRATNLDPGQELPVLVRTESEAYVPYLVDDVPLVLTEDKPVAVVGPGRYRIDVSDLPNPNDTVITNSIAGDEHISSSEIVRETTASGTRLMEIVNYDGVEYPAIREVVDQDDKLISEYISSVRAYYGNGLNPSEIEVVRFSKESNPILFHVGTMSRIDPYDPKLISYELPSETDDAAVISKLNDLMSVTANSQPRHVLSTTLDTVDVYTVSQTFGQSVTIQNRSGLLVLYSFDGSNEYEIADRERITLTAIGNIEITPDPSFVASATNPGVVVSLYDTQYATP